MTRVGDDPSLDVSRETRDRLDLYESLLKKWQRSINLVAASTLDAVWDRHFQDSLALARHAPKAASHWLDLGSGAGFPGLVCAIALAPNTPDLKFSLVESDKRKCSFLREVARQTNTPVTILDQRIDSLPPQQADIISARALAPLPKLLAFSEPHLVQNGLCLFPKGANHQAELAEARRDWHFECDTIPSPTSAESVLLKLHSVARISDAND